MSVYVKMVLDSFFVTVGGNDSCKVMVLTIVGKKEGNINNSKMKKRSYHCLMTAAV